MSLLSLGLAFLAGVLTILSPCVLPLLPMILAGAVNQHRWGPAALAIGLSSAFTFAGLILASAGFALGLDPDSFRNGGAVFMLVIGAILAVPRLTQVFGVLAGPLSNWANSSTQGWNGSGLWGQAGLGALLGLVWSPCVGPTLGAATLLASQGESIVQAGLTMLSFGLGTGLTLLLFGMVARKVLKPQMARIHGFSAKAKIAMGLAMLVIGFSVLSGFDKVIETFLVRASPEWLTDLTTAF